MEAMMELTLLLVEDSPLSRLVEIDGLQKAASLVNVKLNILEAESADEAWKLWRLDTIDGIVTDLYLNGSVTGIDLLTEIKKEAPTLPCTFVTGMADPENMAKLWKICPTITKPIEAYFPYQVLLLLREMKLYKINREKTDAANS